MTELFLIALASVYWEDKYVYTGARFNPNALSFAHRTLPMGTCVVFEYQGRTSPAILNDRGPCFSNKCKATRPDLLQREFDLSLGLAKALKFPGLGKVKYKIGCK